MAQPKKNGSKHVSWSHHFVPNTKKFPRHAMCIASKVCICVVACSCVCDASHERMRVQGLRTWSLHRAISRTSHRATISPVIDSKGRRSGEELEGVERDHEDQADHKEEDHEDETDGHDDHAEEHSEEEHSEEEHSASVNLRIGGIFITGITTLLGLVPFMAVAADKIPATLILCVRSAAAGTMLSLALVHILPESSHKLEAVTPFPLAGTLMAVGVFLSFVVQLVCHGSPQERTAAPSKDAELGHAHPIGAPEASPIATAEFVHQCCSVSAEPGSSPSKVAGDDRVSRVESKVVIMSMEAGCVVHSVNPEPKPLNPQPETRNAQNQTQQPPNPDPKRNLSRSPHRSPSCTLSPSGSLPPSPPLSLSLSQKPTFQDQVIIGLSLGLVTEYSTLAVLIGVLAVHQFLEGLSIGYILSGLASKVSLIPHASPSSVPHLPSPLPFYLFPRADQASRTPPNPRCY